MINYYLRITIAIILAIVTSSMLMKTVFVNNTPTINVERLVAFNKEISESTPTSFWIESEPLIPTATESVPTPHIAHASTYPTIIQSTKTTPIPEPSRQLTTKLTATSVPRAVSTKRPTPSLAPSPTTHRPTPTSTAIACPNSSSNSYQTISTNSEPTQNAAFHPDINLKVRGYLSSQGELSIINIDGPTDYKAPQLATMFSIQRRPVFKSIYNVYDWNWSTNSKGNLIDYTDIQLVGIAYTPGENLRVPKSGYSIGEGKEVMVLYASISSITLVYTRDDSAAHGYVLHIEDICVDPNMLALYKSTNASGRSSLPALPEGKVIGKARTNEVKVAIRDTGQFMDPRSRKDWWVGY